MSDEVESVDIKHLGDGIQAAVDRLNLRLKANAIFEIAAEMVLRSGLQMTDSKNISVCILASSKLYGAAELAAEFPLHDRESK